MKFRIFTLTIIFYMIKSIFSATMEECLNTSPTQKDDCFSKTTSTQYCCYKVRITNQEKSCILKDKTLSDLNAITINNGGYEYVDCGAIGGINSNTSNQPGQSEDKNENSLNLPYRVCGNFNPKEPMDCNSHSVFGNSCCFYQKDGKTGCYSLGRTYFGEATYDNMKVTCASCKLQIYGYLIISFIMLILFN